MPFSSTLRDVPATRRSRLWRRIVLALLGAAWLATACWQTNKTLPPGTHVAGPWYELPASDITFIADITSADAYGRPVVSQAIFDTVLAALRTARRFIVLDYFLFNSQGGNGEPGAPLRPIAAELRDALIQRLREQPGLQVLFITDPINEVYGGRPSRELLLLRAAGAEVIVTNLDRLRDSNFAYSSLWRLAIAWWSGGENGGIPDAEQRRGWLPNPLDESAAPIEFGAWARMLNFKANHRKVLIADDGRDGVVAIVGSANPHDASSGHSNLAMQVRGPVVWPLLRSELAIARFSGWQGELRGLGASAQTAATSARADAAAGATNPGTGVAASRAPRTGASATPSGTGPAASSGAGAAAPAVRAQILTEGAVRSALLEHLNGTGRGEHIDIAMFYISDRGVVESLIAASRRGVSVRLILDPNREAFGHDKPGLPNQPVASELVAASDGAIHVRWYRTHGEQFHPKLAMIYGREHLWLTAGSANLTRRNLADYNLEANIAVEVVRSSALAIQALDYFETLWSNRASMGIEFTADFGVYADPSQLHYWLYRIMEATGLSSF